jgi:hypothetical protein
VANICVTPRLRNSRDMASQLAENGKSVRAKIEVLLCISRFLSYKAGSKPALLAQLVTPSRP